MNLNWEGYTKCVEKKIYLAASENNLNIFENLNSLLAHQ